MSSKPIVILDRQAQDVEEELEGPQGELPYKRGGDSCSLA